MQSPEIIISDVRRNARSNRKWLTISLVAGIAAAIGLPGPDRGERGRQLAAAPAETDAKPKEYAPLFVDWPKPKLAIVISGLQQGFIEPCGCAGLDNQKGGLGRRHALLRQLAADGWPVVAVDLGGQVSRFGKQTELKFQATADALRTMDYRAVGLGPQELRLPVETLLAATSAVGDQSTPFVCANVRLLGLDDAPRFRMIESGGMKLGVTSVVGEQYRQGINNPDIQIQPAEAAIAEVLPELKRAHCDRLLLFAHAPVKESTQLAQRFPDFHLVVTAGGADEPPAQPIQIAPGRQPPGDSANAARQPPGTPANGGRQPPGPAPQANPKSKIQNPKSAGTSLIEVGQKGMYVVVVGLFDDPSEPMRFQRVPLDARFKETAEMKQVMASYQDQLQELGLEGLGVVAAPNPRGEFAGSQACADCHTKAHAIWSKTPHSHATDTLVKLDPPRHFDPECLSCHVTGWQPQRYVPWTGGFLGLEATPLLHENGCENCHGPAAAHVKAESSDAAVSDKEISRLRQALRLPYEQAESNCLECHDQDNSPAFDFKAWWPKVEHKGKD